MVDTALWLCRSYRVATGVPTVESSICIFGVMSHITGTVLAQKNFPEEKASNVYIYVDLPTTDLSG